MPTVRELMRDAAGRLVAVDGRLWRTLRVLLFRPGMLTREYLGGRRKRYVRPARLFFVMSLLLFATIRLVVAPTNIMTIDVADERPAAGAADATASSPAAADKVPAGATPPTATMHVDPDFEALLASYGKYVPADWRKSIARFQHLSREDQNDQVYSGLLRYAPYGMVVLLPAFALLQYWSYLPGRRQHPSRPARYAEHLVYGAHLHAFAFLMLIAIILMPLPALRLALVGWTVVYAGRARGNVYGGTWRGGLIRSLLVALVYIVLLGMVMAALLALSIATR